MTEMDICDLCRVDSGRMNARLRCCKVRMISKLPKAQRQAYYERVRQEEGELSLQALIAEVNKEYRRRTGQQQGGSEK